MSKSNQNKCDLSPVKRVWVLTVCNTETGLDYIRVFQNGMQARAAFAEKVEELVEMTQNPDADIEDQDNLMELQVALDTAIENGYNYTGEDIQVCLTDAKVESTN